MYFKITKDHLFDGRYIKTSHVGRTLTYEDQMNVKGELLDVRLLDDDRELYYEAEADDEALEMLYEWAYSDAGVTILQVLNKESGEWIDEIG